MKTNLLHLDSVVPNGVGGPETGMINFIYTALLQEYGMDLYRYIHINQIGDDLNELIINRGKEVYINVRIPAHNDFKQKTVEEKNLIRLDIIHLALLRIAEQNKKIDIKILEEIKEKVIKSNFSFDFAYKTYINSKNE